jgi:hypothetical protein
MRLNWIVVVVAVVEEEDENVEDGFFQMVITALVKSGD